MKGIGQYPRLDLWPLKKMPCRPEIWWRGNPGICRWVISLPGNRNWNGWGEVGE
jgi:hypothetical protein